MGNSSSSHKISAQDRAILDMKNQRDKLHQYQKRITVITAQETAIARDCLARGDKSRALLALRRKKFQESLLAKADGQLEALEQLTSNVEFARLQNDVIFGLQQGTSVLKQIHSEMGGLEQVDKLMGENQEALAYQKEISEMLAGELSNADEDEVEDELEALQKGMELEEGEGQEDGVEYPAAPSHELAFAGELRDGRQKKAWERARAQKRKVALAQQPMLA